MNTNEKVKLVMRAPINNREMNDLVARHALEKLEKDTPLPAEIADLFTVEIFTRPSGSRFAIVDFA